MAEHLKVRGHSAGWAECAALIQRDQSCTILEKHPIAIFCLPAILNYDIHQADFSCRPRYVILYVKCYQHIVQTSQTHIIITKISW